jgi:TolB-like protein
MSDPGKAVFLSYAREDTDAARRMADALRGYGIEVWLDQSELTGGDEWDAKIRGQIGTCALFMPVISAHTQERLEGYFRLEWKLAEDRSYLMAKGKPFIVPVVVDATGEKGAQVPDAFLKVQWTRLPGGETNPAFVERVKRLLGNPDKGTVSPVAGLAEAGHPAFAKASVGGPGSATPATTKRVPAWIWGAAVLGLVAIGAVIVARRTAAPVSSPASPIAESKPAANAPGLAVVSDKSIAVLPFTNMSEDKDASAFFADGMHEDILTNLAHIRELRVVSRTSVMSYRGTAKQIPLIARELNVAYVLEGSVRRAGNKVRVTGQLIHAGTDEHVWAKSYDRDLNDVFAIQAELAQAIAQELDTALTPRERQLITARPTESTAAYELFLKTREVANSGDTRRQAYSTRESFLEAALRLDPKFANAWAELAVVQTQMLAASVDATAARRAKARDALDRAMALAPSTPQVTRAQGAYYLFIERDLARAEAAFARLQQQQPNDADSVSWMAAVQTLQGRWAEALASGQLAVKLDPANASFRFSLGTTYMLIRRYDDLLAEMRNNKALRPQEWTNESDFFYAVMTFSATGSHEELLSLLRRLEAEDSKSPMVIQLRKFLARARRDFAEYLRLVNQYPGENNAGGAMEFASTPGSTVQLLYGDRELAISQFKEFLHKIEPQLVADPDNTQLLRVTALLNAFMGRRDEALRLINHAAELVPESRDARIGYGISQIRASVDAWTGDKDRAIAELKRLLGLPGMLNIHRMKIDPVYAPLWDDPRFQALVNDPKNNAPLF